MSNNWPLENLLLIFSLEKIRNELGGFIWEIFWIKVSFDTIFNKYDALIIFVQFTDLLIIGSLLKRWVENLISSHPSLNITSLSINDLFKSRRVDLSQSRIKVGGFESLND